MNISILRGRLTADAEIHIKPEENQTETARFSIAVPNINRNDENGKHPVDFIKIVAFNSLARNIAKYTKKGSEITVVGRLHTYSYKNKDDKTVYMTEIVADRIEFISGCVSGADIADTPDEASTNDAPIN